MTLSRLKLAITTLLIAGTAACVPRYVNTIGNDFDQTQFSRFTVGTTTIEDARQMVGPPVQTIKNKEGRTAMIWKYIGSQTTLNESMKGASIHKEVMAVFDEQGKFLRIQNEVNQGGASGKTY